MIAIPLTQGKTAIIDDEDADMVSRFSWHLWRSGRYLYASASVPQSGKKGVKTEIISLHRLIMRFPKNSVDHINGNGLDCRKINMREATKSQNRMNSRLQSNSKTGFVGVWMRPEPQPNRYRAHIQLNGKKIILGHFKTAVEAAKAYNVASLKYHGEFGRRNVVD